MRRSILLRVSISFLLCGLMLALAGCFGSFTGGVDRVVAQADRSDPVRAAVVAALAVIDEDFAPILTEPFSESERTAMVDDGMKFKGLGQGQSSMDVLRMLEAQAESARHVSVQIPGAEAIGYRTDVETGGVSATSRFIEWRFPVAFERRREVAADLVARVAPLFAADPKWNRVSISDPAVNPLAATTSYSLYLDISVGGASEFAMVSVDYWHDREDFEAMKGVRLYVSKLNSRPN